MTNDSTRILVVDDEFSVRDSLCSWFRKEGYHVGAAENASDALQRLQEEAWDLVLLDIKMPGMDGLELQRRISQVNPDIVVIIITGYGSVHTAVQALKDGAFDYVTKPIEPDQLTHLVRLALEQRHLKTENIRLREKLEGLATLEEIVGESPQMERARALVASAARSNAAVLIRGSRGTGKEHLARAIHAASKRRYFPIVRVSCDAMADRDLEGDLLGHAPGALPAARYPHKGKLQIADGGTLFVDEIGAAGPTTQATLLQVLDSKQFTPIGDTQAIRTDLRLICATTRDLESLVQEGRFREDLYYQINLITIDLPSLCERRADIPLLARHFLSTYAAQLNKHVAGITPEAMDVLTRHHWPGNVRELANAVERAVVVGDDPMIRPEDLPVRVTAGSDAALGDSLAAVEKAHITRVLQRTGWDIPRAAETLGIDRATLCNKIDTYGLRA